MGPGPTLTYFDGQSVAKGHRVSIHKHDSTKVGTGRVERRLLTNPSLVEVVVDGPGFVSEGVKFDPLDTARMHLHPSFLLLNKQAPKAKKATGRGRRVK